MRTALKLLPICLIGCAGLKPFPTSTLIEYDNKHKVCGQYQIVDLEKFRFEYVKDIPCPAVFGFTAKDIPNVLNWAQDAEDYARQHCQ